MERFEKKISELDFGNDFQLYKYACNNRYKDRIADRKSGISIETNLNEEDRNRWVEKLQSSFFSERGEEVEALKNQTEVLKKQLAKVGKVNKNLRMELQSARNALGYSARVTEHLKTELTKALNVPWIPFRDKIVHLLLKPISTLFGLVSINQADRVKNLLKKIDPLRFEKAGTGQKVSPKK